jgi:hypothetical protein
MLLPLRGLRRRLVEGRLVGRLHVQWRRHRCWRRAPLRRHIRAARARAGLRHAPPLLQESSFT